MDVGEQRFRVESEFTFDFLIPRPLILTFTFVFPTQRQGENLTRFPPLKYSDFPSTVHLNRNSKRMTLSTLRSKNELEENWRCSEVLCSTEAKECAIANAPFSPTSTLCAMPVTAFTRNVVPEHWTHVPILAMPFLFYVFGRSTLYCRYLLQKQILFAVKPMWLVPPTKVQTLNT